MKTATITEVRNGLSAFLDRVRQGESIVILDRGTPVARLEPVRSSEDATGRLRRLVRAGLVETARTDTPMKKIRAPGPTPAPAASAVRALLEERHGGR
ncbi:MAG: type II toxin-antitoxin system prevent-host-death family antitoxin [Gemmatimonadota bacterium]